MALKKCKECGHQVSTKAKNCPDCGVKNPTSNPLLNFIVWVVIIIFAFVWFTSGDEDTSLNIGADKFSTISLNMREGPSTVYDIVTSLSPGEQVKVLRDSIGWHLVETIERDEVEIGWASGNYLSNISQLKDWEESVRQEQNRQEQRERERIANKPPTREEQIESGFSFWDGSHIELKKEVKKRMHNPDSFDHVETRYGDYDDYLFVTMKFRGTNAFGAVVTHTATAHCDIDGDVIEILTIN